MGKRNPTGLFLKNPKTTTNNFEEKMYILGISCYYHDSSATLLKNGKVLAAADEERFSRIKHDSSFPMNAINYCLTSQNITIQDIDKIAFYEKPILKFERMISQHVEMFPKSYKTFLLNMPGWINTKLRILKTIRKLKYKKQVFFIKHHLSHAASAFLPSVFEKSAILTVDGVGEWTTLSFGIGNKNKIELQKQIKFPHSIGLLYSTITAYLGFRVNNSEYKVMGLAAYGDQNKKTNIYYKKLRKIIDLKPDGSFCLDMNYFSYLYSNKMPSKELIKLLGGPVRKGKLQQRHKDIAAALQMLTEEILIKILNYVHKETKQENLVMAGGVALNSVFNGKIIRKTPFRRIWIQPHASDGGASMGTALYVHNINSQRNFEFDNPYLGPSFSSKYIKQYLKKNNIKYYEFKNSEEKIKKAARLIHENKIVAWFQGRMEWGPRALGARSILANPCDPDAKQILNKKVKHREPFRPFAPVVCREDAVKYFIMDKPIPKPTQYMLMVFPVKKKYRNRIPSVTHVDGTARPQMLPRKINAQYYDLIKEFGKLSGIPILINTSFNVRGEPIVCTPEDAYNCFISTGIDALFIENFIIKKQFK